MVPGQLALAPPEMPVGAVESALTVMDTVGPPVWVLHGAGSILLTQYTVELVGFTVIETVFPLMGFEPTV